MIALLDNDGAALTAPSTMTIVAAVTPAAVSIANMDVYAAAGATTL
jgi:hypothetical protein